LVAGTQAKSGNLGSMVTPERPQLHDQVVMVRVTVWAVDLAAAVM
jgi:hypothetical protein